MVNENGEEKFKNLGKQLTSFVDSSPNVHLFTKTFSDIYQLSVTFNFFFYQWIINTVGVEWKKSESHHYRWKIIFSLLSSE